MVKTAHSTKTQQPGIHTGTTSVHSLVGNHIYINDQYVLPYTAYTLQKGQKSEVLELCVKFSNELWHDLS